MEIIAILTPIGAAIAWLWHEIVKARKDAIQEEIAEADRERSYSDRLEKRILEKEKELEKVLVQLMDLRARFQSPLEILHAIISEDIGISWATKDGIVVARSKKSPLVVGQEHHVELIGEGMHVDGGRVFKWGEYILGIYA